MDAQKAKALVAGHFAKIGDISDNDAFEAYVQSHAANFHGDNSLNVYVKAATELGLIESTTSTKEVRNMANITQPAGSSSASIAAQVNASQSERAQNAAATSVSRIYVDKKPASELTKAIKEGNIAVDKEGVGLFEKQRINLEKKGWKMVDMEYNGVSYDSQANFKAAQDAKQNGTPVPMKGASTNMTIVAVDLANGSGLNTNLKCLSVKGNTGLKAFMGLYTNGAIEAPNKNSLGIMLRRYTSKSKKTNTNVTGAAEYKVAVSFKNKAAALQNTTIEYTKEDSSDPNKLQKVNVDSDLALLFSKPSAQDPTKTLFKVVYVKISVFVRAQVRKQQYEEIFGKSTGGFSDKQINNAHDAVADILADLNSESNFAATTKLTPSDIDALRKIGSATGGADWAMD